MEVKGGCSKGFLALAAQKKMEPGICLTPSEMVLSYIQQKHREIVDVGAGGAGHNEAVNGL